MTPVEYGAPTDWETSLPEYPSNGSDDAEGRYLGHVVAGSDQVFRVLSRAGGMVVLTIMVLVGIYLTTNAVEAVSAVGVGEFATTQEWSPETNHFGIAAVLVGTILIAIVALVVALPLSLGLSLFITEVAGGGLQRSLRSAIDLMAAVPSVVFGLWGLAWMQSRMVPFAAWLSDWFGWIPFFAVEGKEPGNPLPNDALYTSSTFMAGLVVSLMVLPIMTSMMIESFSRAPIGEREGAYALGATRWGMIRSVVLPFGRGGMIGGTMLGLGRALGETIGVYLIISPLFEIHFRIVERGANSIAALIALRYGEANDFAMSALMAAGLALFLMTMAINFIASSIIARSRSGAESEA